MDRPRFPLSRRGLVEQIMSLASQSGYPSLLDNVGIQSHIDRDLFQQCDSRAKAEPAKLFDPKVARCLVHTNGLENFWSLFKRALKGTYTHCEPFHLQRYVDEEVFRFNQRKDNDAGRFDDVMSHVAGRRLTWRLLCGVDGAGFMGLQ